MLYFASLPQDAPAETAQTATNPLVVPVLSQCETDKGKAGKEN